ncbi:MAG: N-acyl-L-amino acid amidohydrolase [Bacteroidetes bacterium]|nr:MAG: N-acyl-L-amino acid amidohydrolase [Bacteroidota bacterium]
MNLSNRIKQLVEANFDELVSTRRHLHSNPELSFEEFETTKFIASKLKDNGFDLQKITETGGYIDIKGKNPGSRTIALRGDIDALPISEQNEKEYTSKNEGVMHACGHDVHTTCLLGAIQILNELKDEFEGTIRCIFQPGEEKLPGGASIMIKNGVLKNPRVEKILGQHVMPLIDAGKVGFRSGLYMASADEIYIKVIGKGGHGAHPHQNIDPVVIAAQIITQLQTVVSRHTKPSIPSVLSIGKVIANGATNIIPNEVYMEGTFRTYDEEWRMKAHTLIEKICNDIAEAHGAKCEAEVRKGYPFLKNDEDLSNNAQAWAVEYLGAENVEDLEIWPAGEDFAYYSQEIPACFYRLGIRNEAEGITSMLHTPTFDVDEKALKVGAGLMAYLAVRELGLK